VDRQCGSSQQAVHFAAAGLIAGQYDVVVAGGVESMSRVPMGSSINGQNPLGSSFLERYHGAFPNQGVGAEMIAEQWGFSRTDLDQFSLGSHEKAAAAQDSGAFDDRIVAIKDQEGNAVLKDEGIRRGGTLESMAKIKPAFKEDGVIHAGNSSQISDGSAAVMWASRRAARALGLTPRARIVAQALVGADPHYHLDGPIDATRAVLGKAGMTLKDINIVEINEAFASVVLSWAQVMKADMEKVNVNGGAIALGHPVGCTGARLITTALHELERSGKEFALVTMCAGGALATGTIIQRL
jgi:acetyl-CoA acyltransferase